MARGGLRQVGIRYVLDTSGLKEGERTGISAVDNLVGRFGNLERAAAAVRGNIGLVAGGLAALAAAAVGGAAIAAVARLTRELYALGEASVESYGKQEQALRQLAAGVKSTGGVAGLTTKELAALASGLQDVTTYGDETVMEMESVLLTFTKIGRDTFPRAAEAVLDVATRMKTDLTSAALQVGKALNDPVRGLDGLSRAGIQFSDQQKEVIKSLAETGQIAAAQALILKELENQFGGSARAAAEGTGVYTQLQNKLDDLREVVGAGLSPSLEELAALLLKVASSDDAIAFARGLGSVMAGAVDGVNVLTEGLSRLIPVIERLVQYRVPEGFSLFFGLAGVSGAAAGVQAGQALSPPDPTPWERWRDTVQEARDDIEEFRAVWSALEQARTLPDVLSAEQQAALDRFVERSLPDHQRKIAELTREYEELREKIGDNAELAAAFEAQLDRINREASIRSQIEALGEQIRAEKEVGKELEERIRLRREERREIREAAEALEAQRDAEALAQSPFIQPPPLEPPGLSSPGDLADEAEQVWREHQQQIQRLREVEGRELAAGLGHDIGTSVASALSDAIRGAEVDGQALAESIGSAIGFAIGSAIGGPTGGAIGGILGGAFGSALFDDSPDPSAYAEQAGSYVSAMVDAVTGEFRSGIDQISQEMAEALQELFATISGSVFDIPNLSVQIRNDGERFRALVQGELVGTFDTAAEAMGAAFLEGLRRSSFVGVAEEVLQVIANSSVSTTEQLFAQLDVAQRIADLRTGVGETGRAIRELNAALAETTGIARGSGLDASELVREFVRSLEDLRRSVTGEQISPFEQFLTGMQDFNAGLEEQRRRAEAELAQILARIGDAQDAARNIGLMGDDVARGLRRMAESLPALLARAQELELLLSLLPPPISEGEYRPRGGGGRGQQRADLRDRLRDQAEGFGLSGFEQQLLDVQRRFEEFAEQLREARFPAQEAAELLKRAAEQREREIEALRESLAQRVEDFTRTGPTSDLEQQLANLARTRDQLIADIRALSGARAEELAQIEAVLRAEQERIEALRDEQRATEGNLLAALLEAAGRTEEAAQLRWNLELQGYKLAILEIELRRELLGLEGDVTSQMWALLEEITNAGPPDTGAGGAGDPSGNIYTFPGGGGFDDLAAEIERARDAVQGYLDLADPYGAALRDHIAEFAEYRRLLGDTVELEQAQNLALRALNERFLGPLVDLYYAMTGGSLSAASPAEQVDALQARVESILAAVEGGDYSQAGLLGQLGQQLLQLYASTHGSAGGGYQAILELLSPIEGILQAAGLLPGFAAGADLGTRGPLADVLQFPQAQVSQGAQASQGVVTAIRDHQTAEIIWLQRIEAAINRSGGQVTGQLRQNDANDERRAGLNRRTRLQSAGVSLR